jgi:hypothetical protein
VPENITENLSKLVECPCVAMDPRVIFSTSHANIIITSLYFKQQYECQISKYLKQEITSSQEQVPSLIYLYVSVASPSD